MKRLRISGERGTSLVEVLTVVAILSIVMVFVTGTFGSLFFTTERTELRLQNLDEARLIINGMTKDIRTATRWDPVSSPFGTGCVNGNADGQPTCSVAAGSPPAIGLAADSELIFYANLDPAGPPTGPRKIHIYVDSSSRLVEEITRPTATCSAPFTCTYGATPTSTRILGYYVVNSGALFSYYDDSTAVPTLLAPTPLSVTNLVKVGQIQITLTIRKQTNFQVPAATIINQVRMPNVDYNPLGP